MKNFLYFLVAILITLSSNTAQDDVAGLFSTSLTPPNYSVTLSTQMVSNPGAAQIIQLEFTYNGAALSFPASPVKGTDYVVHGGFDAYPNINVVQFPNIIRISMNTFAGVVPLTTSPTQVATFNFDILDQNATTNLEWNLTNIQIAPSFGADPYNVVAGNWPNLTDQPLPVELSSFNVNAVEGIKAQLQWETATEVNNYGFEIERSVVTENAVKDASAPLSMTDKQWEKVAFVEGHGNSNSPKLYSFTDKNLIGGSKFVYRLKQIDIDGTFEYSDEVEIEILPTKYELMQNYPNPFNPTTKIRFSLPEDAKIGINIYNILGEKVASVLNEELKAGFHEVDFNSSSAGYSLATGVYIYTIETKNFSQVKKMILMK